MRKNTPKSESISEEADPGRLIQELEKRNIELSLFNKKLKRSNTKAVKVLKNIEYIFSCITESISDGIVIFNAENQTVYISPSYLKQLGYSKKTRLQLTPDTIYELVHPDDRNTILSNHYEAIKLKKHHFLHSYRILHKDGHYIWREDNSTYKYDREGNYDGTYTICRDVTRIKLEKEHLKLLESVITNTNDSVIITEAEPIDLTGIRILYVNEAFTRMTGYTPEEVIGKTPMILYGPKTDRTILKEMGEAIRKWESFECTIINYKKNGEEFWINFSIIPVANEKGWYTHWIAIEKDVTEKKLIEEKLNKANRLYLFTSQINQMMLRGTDETTLFKEACSIAIDIGKFRMAWIGLVNEKTKIVNPVIFDGMDLNYVSTIQINTSIDSPEGKGPTGMAIREGKYVICNDIETNPMMAPWRKLALQRKFLSSIALPIKRFGKVIGAYTLYADSKNFFDTEEIAMLCKAADNISFSLEAFDKEVMRTKAAEALLKSERRYLTLAEISPVGIFQSNKNGYITYVNPSWTKITDLPRDEALGHGWIKIIHKEDRNSFLKNWQEKSSDQNHSPIEFRVVRKDGGISWVIGHSAAERNSENKIIGYVGTLIDITERKKAEADTLKTTEQLQKLTAHLQTIREEERKRIGRELHDELGQQLTAIKMDIAWINKQPLVDPKPIKSKLKNVTQLLDESNTSLRRILNELRPTIFGEHGLLDALIDHGKQFTDITGTPVELITDEKEIKVPEKIATCIFRVFQEALTNITRYAEANKVVTSVKLDKGSILINIQDNGKGFDTLAVHSETRQSFGLLGMRERVRALDGEFHLISSIGMGTNITIRLPLY